jgi:hypothetical protein
MSKLIDRLVQTTETVSLPMGFRATKATPTRSKMVLIVYVEPAVSTAQLVDYLSSADAAIFANTGKANDISRSFPDTVWGLWLEGISHPQIKGTVEAGADFVVLPLESEFSFPDIEKAGKILLVEASLSEGLTRTINELPADAVLLTDGEGEKQAITWHQLMVCQRFSDLLSKPLLLTVPISVKGEELKALWKAGVDGVIISVKTLKQAERLKELREIINKSDFAARPRKKLTALLPHIGEKADTAAADVEDEEEEEE